MPRRSAGEGDDPHAGDKHPHWTDAPTHSSPAIRRYAQPTQRREPASTGEDVGSCGTQHSAPLPTSPGQLSGASPTPDHTHGAPQRNAQRAPPAFAAPTRRIPGRAAIQRDTESVVSTPLMRRDNPSGLASRSASGNNASGRFWYA